VSNFADLASKRDLGASYTAFLQSRPEYATTALLDELRASEYSRLDHNRHVYLDYTGGGQYAHSQLARHFEMLGAGVYGNPHSQNLTSLAMTERVEHTRARVLRFFNADPDEYIAVFTPNATGALRLVGEAYPFGRGGTYLLTADNHNSVNGIREFARGKGAEVRYVPITTPELRIEGGAVFEALDVRGEGHSLFAYPAQSNFTGVQHPPTWIDSAHQRGWDVLLDAASFVPTNRLDLGRWKPDFVDLSFYKMLGYPTGLGCLLVRRSALAKLQRPWYSGGTITFSSVAAEDHYLTPGFAAFEDGTVNYLSIPAIDRGLDLLEQVGYPRIHQRVDLLTGWLIAELLALRHANGQPLVQLYGPETSRRRGGTVQVNFFDPHGALHDCFLVEQLANDQRISLRAGCHCNPGAREAALGFSRDDLVGCFQDKHARSYDQFLRDIAGKTTGAVRASFGIASNFADAFAYVQFAAGLLDRPQLRP
jgi:molybdenum cofactor sulfurtransferase